MTEEFIEFPESIKSCSVVLERLDDKLLSQYSQKYNIKMVDVVKHSKIHSNDFSDKSKGNRRAVKKSVKINKFKKRRRRNRVICSSDDESSNETSFIKQSQNFLTGVIKDNSGKTDKVLDDSRSLDISNSKDAHNEIEVIQEITNLTSKNADFEEDESDLREDNEDDRITVIFEELPNRKCEIECSVEEFKNKISTVRNSESEEKVAENSASIELIKEDYLKKLCSLVRRLHELFRIISQLQIDEPQNDDLAVHFSKVVKAQKTSFLREIKLSQKPVIEYYEKLLTFYENSNEVIAKVSQHALLSLEDVSNIISRCLLLGKFHQKSNEKQPKNFRRVSDNLKKLLGKKVSKNNQIAPQLYSFPPSEGVSYEYEIIPTADESVIPTVIPAGKDVVNIQNPSDPRLRTFLPSYNDYCIQKQNIWAQKKNQNQVFDPFCRASSQNDFRYPSEVPDSLKRSSYPQNMASDFLVNSTISQKRPNPEFSPPEIPIYPFCVQNFYVPNGIQQKSVLEQASFSNFNSPLQNLSTCASLRQRNPQKGNLPFPSNIHHKDVQRLARHPLGDYFNDSVRFSKQNPYELFASGEEIFGNPSFNKIEFRNNANEVAEEVLDLTVPGYLPVQNYRTQGSTAVRVTEGNKGESSSFQSFCEMEDYSGLRTKNSNFRIYVCAQSNCKMPGIRICKGCQSVIYCSEICQLKHWALKHKMECYQLRELRMA